MWGSIPAGGCFWVALIWGSQKRALSKTRPSFSWAFPPGQETEQRLFQILLLSLPYKDKAPQSLSGSAQRQKVIKASAEVQLEKPHHLGGLSCFSHLICFHSLGLGELNLLFLSPALPQNSFHVTEQEPISRGNFPANTWKLVGTVPRTRV